MEQKRQEAVQKLGELKKIKFIKPTARELHSIRPMLSRVKRQEMKRYESVVKRQKVKLTKDVSDIDKYLQSVSDYEAYMASNGIGPAPVVLPKPNVIVGIKPILKKTRLPRYKIHRKRRVR
jgi:hypothetical protein